MDTELNQRQSRKLIAVVTPGDVNDPGSFSGLPHGLKHALQRLDFEVLPVQTWSSSAVEQATLAVLGLSFLRREDVRHPRVGYWRARMQARHLDAFSRLTGMLASRRLHSAGQPLSGIIQHGCEVELRRPPARYVTFEDQTLALARRAPHEYEHLTRTPIRSLERWEARHRRVYRKAEACCTTSHWAAESAINDYDVPRDRVHVVGIGRNNEPALIERDWSIPKFLWIGKEWTRKNGQAVIDAFAEVRSEVPGAELHVVGSHPPLQAPGVHCHAFLDPSNAEQQTRLTSLFARATCFVLPSLHEPSATAYAEAAAAGLGSIGTTAGGSATIIQDGGILIDPQAPAELTRAMRRFCDPQVACALGERACRRSVLFTWEAVARRLVRALGLPVKPPEDPLLSEYLDDVALAGNG